MLSVLLMFKRDQGIRANIRPATRDVNFVKDKDVRPK